MTPPKVVVVDYGLGNLRSVAAAITEVGGVPEVTSDLNSIRRAERIVLPGVGAFGLAAEHLETSFIGPAVVAAAERGTPILGICLGMQLLFDRGNEFGWTSGLGLIRGDVVPILRPGEKTGLRDTHVGWRPLNFSSSQKDHPLFEGIGITDSFYFVHSFAAQAVEESNVIATVTYGTEHLVVATTARNVMGLQFHPEKSGEPGLRVLKNFIRQESFSWNSHGT
jgi:glutamine amidotransferase